jgi:hypothetical protein
MGSSTVPRSPARGRVDPETACERADTLSSTASPDCSRYTPTDSNNLLHRVPDAHGIPPAKPHPQTAYESQTDIPFDQLGSLLDGLFWREQDVHVVRHDHESMQKKSRLIPIAKDCSDQQLGVGRALEDAPSFM